VSVVFRERRQISDKLKSLLSCGALLMTMCEVECIDIKQEPVSYLLLIFILSFRSTEWMSQSLLNIYALLVG